MGNSSSSGDVYALVDANKVDELLDILEGDPDEVDLLNEDGETLLFRACSNGNAVIVQELLERGADIGITCDDITALHVASAAHSPKSVQLLLEKGADPNARTLDGTTPLHCALQYGDFIAAKLLIEKGADVTATNHEGQAPFDVQVDDQQGLDVEPLSDAQVQMLRNLAGQVAAAANENNDDEVDLETMRLFFRQAGLDSSESRKCSGVAVHQNIKTGKKLALLVLTGKMGLDVFELEAADEELVSLACREVMPYVLKK